MAHDPISMVLREIYHTIPVDILNSAFKPTDKNSTLDACIQEKIIENRVLQDCNLVGGRTKFIPLRMDWLQKTEPLYGITGAISGHTGVYRIPPEAREHKPIVAAINLKPPHTFTGYQSMGFLGNNCGSGAASAMACNALNSVLGTNGGATPSVELLTGDMIRLIPPQVMSLEWVLQCRLAFDVNFTNMTPNSIRHLIALVLCATKTFIYTELIIRIDRGFITGGAEIGVIKSIVEGYVDQYEKYPDLLKNFQGSCYSEVMRGTDLLRYMMG